MPRTAFIGVAWSELERTLARERRRTASDQPAATPGTGKILLRHSGRLALPRTLEALDPDDRRLLLQNVLAVEGRHLRIVGGVLRVTAVRPAAVGPVRAAAAGSTAPWSTRSSCCRRAGAPWCSTP